MKEHKIVVKFVLNKKVSVQTFLDDLGSAMDSWRGTTLDCVTFFGGCDHKKKENDKIIGKGD
jgi:hypothetical protein